MATITELKTCLGVEAVYDLLEIMAVDAHNRNVMNAKRDRE